MVAPVTSYCSACPCETWCYHAGTIAALVSFARNCQSGQVQKATARYRNASKGTGEEVNFVAVDVCFELIEGAQFNVNRHHPLWRAIRNKLVCSYGLHRLKQVMQTHQWVESEQLAFCNIAPCLGMDHSWLGSFCEVIGGCLDLIAIGC